MEMRGRYLLPVSRDQAWEALNDPEVLAACIPGCEKLELLSDDELEAVLALRVGPLSATFKGRVHLLDRVRPEAYTLRFEGQGGAVGFGNGTARVELAQHAAGSEISYTIQAKVGGKMAQMGQRLIDGVAKSLAETFFQRLEQHLQASTEPSTKLASETRTSAQASTQTLELSRRWAWLMGFGVAVGLLLWIWSA